VTVGPREPSITKRASLLLNHKAQDRGETANTLSEWHASLIVERPVRDVGNYLFDGAGEDNLAKRRRGLPETCEKALGITLLSGRVQRSPQRQS